MMKCNVKELMKKTRIGLIEQEENEPRLNHLFIYSLDFVFSERS